MQGTLRKLKSSLTEPVQYHLPIGDKLVPAPTGARQIRKPRVRRKRKMHLEFVFSAFRRQRQTKNIPSRRFLASFQQQRDQPDQSF